MAPGPAARGADTRNDAGVPTYWKPQRSVRCGLGSSAFIVDRDGVAVRVSERECPAEGTIDRLGQDRHAVLGESVVKGLGVVGPQP